MSKFSSFKESKMLFENWRGHVNEKVTRKVAQELGDFSEMGEEEQEVFKSALSPEQDDSAMQEQQVDANMPPDEKTQEMFQILRSMNSDDSECFNKALKALSKFTGKQDTP